MSSTVRLHRLLDPQALAALRDLSLAARMIVDGSMIGAHASHRAGAGLEFNQFRSYQPGDDPRRIDWKLFGRSDRYFIREAEAETSVTVHLILDATMSMQHREATGTLFDYARFLAAALAALAVRQGDAIGLYALSDGSLDYLPPNRAGHQLHRILHRLELTSPEGVWPAWNRVETLLGRQPGHGVVIFISDLHERDQEISQALQRLAAWGHDVTVTHLVGRSEMDFPWTGSTRFEEWETGKRIEIDAGQARAAFLEHRRNRESRLEADFEDRGIAYHRIVTDTALDLALRRLLRHRRREN